MGEQVNSDGVAMFSDPMFDIIPYITYIYELGDSSNGTWSRDLLGVLGYTGEATRPWGARLRQALVHPDDALRLAEFSQRISQSRVGQIHEIEYRLRHRNGSWRWFFAQETLISRSSSGSAARVLGVLQDITQRKELEEALTRKVNTLQMLAEIERAMGSTLALDERLIILLQKTMEQVPCDMCLVLLAGEDGEMHPLAQRGYSEDDLQDFGTLRVGEGAAGWVMTHGQPLAINDVQQDSRWTPTKVAISSWLGAPLTIKGRVIGVLDVATRSQRQFSPEETEFLALLAGRAAQQIETAQLFEQVRAGREQLKGLSQRLVEAQELERKRLAQELHDQAGQNLTALSLSLNILKSQLPNDDRARLGSRLDDAMKLVEETVMRLRLVMAELRPPALDDYGLGAALHWFADQFSQRTGIPVNVEDAEMPRLPSMVELGLFRIAQEALNNIAKHANPSQAKIRLTEEGGSIRLEIMDDGIGFNPATTRPRKDGGWGLPSMREQAEAFGGSLTVLSAPGKGARVAVSVRRMSDGFEDYTGG